MNYYKHDLQGTSTDTSIPVFNVKAGDIFFNKTGYYNERQSLVLTVLGRERPGVTLVHVFDVYNKKSKLMYVEFAFDMMNWCRL